MNRRLKILKAIKSSGTSVEASIRLHNAWKASEPTTEFEWLWLAPTTDYVGEGTAPREPRKVYAVSREEGKSRTK